MKTMERIEYMRTKPNQALLIPCERPIVHIETNRDMAIALSSYIEAFDVCSAKMDAIIGAFDYEDKTND
jgi:hypothetical protein